ncbi:MAG: hypothetical protein RIF32_16820, partial [Leptospirales bacterium]
MVRPQIKFKNGRSLAFQDGSLAALDQAQAGKTVERWVAGKIRAVIVCCADPGEGRNAAALGALRNAAHSAALRIEIIDWYDSPADPERMKPLTNGVIVPALKAGHVLCLHTGDHQQGFEQFATQLLLALPTPYSDDPVRAIRFLLNRAADPVVDKNIFVFKQKLDPSYILPASPEPQETPMNQSDAVAPTAPGAEVSKGEAFSFRASKFTIKVKLLTIITSILVVSLSVMIFLASGFFREDSQARISENNLNLATVIGSQVESELQGIGYKSNLLALTIDQGIGNAAEQRLFVDLFFEDNPEFIFLAIAERAGGGLRIKRRLYNDKYLSENESLDREKLLNVEAENVKVFAKSLNGAFVVHNASVDVPLIALSQPLGNSVMILYLDPA